MSYHVDVAPFPANRTLGDAVYPHRAEACPWCEEGLPFLSRDTPHGRGPTLLPPQRLPWPECGNPGCANRELDFIKCDDLGEPNLWVCARCNNYWSEEELPGACNG